MSQQIHSWVDGQLAIRARALQTRGFVETGDGARWPRTTGSDVVSIAAVFDPAIKLHGMPGIYRRWRATAADLHRYALRSAHDIYPENRGFWDSLRSMAVYLDDVAVAPPSSSIWDALITEVGARRNVGPTTDGPIAHFDNIKSYDDLFNAQLVFLRDKRGSDTVDGPPGFGGGMRPIPRTTNSDVLQLATYWTNELAKVKEVMGHDGVVARWKPIVADVDAIAKPGKRDEVYAKNNELWRVMQQVATQIAVADEAPSKWEMVVGSIEDSVKHLPQTLGAAAHKGVDVIESAARSVTTAAADVGKGLLFGLLTPVLVVGAGLTGLFLLTRRGHEEA